ncbi:alkaline phosphatase family protein, partial [bacterium]|nr:alkaline phosphatase family protein [bacterium]
MGRSNDIERPGSKVLIIGLDGGTWSVLDRFMELGCMPCLAELCKIVHRSELLSTNPPITPVAWSSFATGMNPGKHGIFGFLSPQSEPGGYSPPPVRRESIRVPSLWRRVSDAGLRTTVLSVPLTYPPEPVNGYMVSGMFTPESAEDSTYPRSLASELGSRESMPRFQLDLTLKASRGRRAETLAQALHSDAHDYFTDLDDLTERLRRAALHLAKQPWDLLVAVFVGTDRLQHVLWDEVMECDPDSTLGRRIGDFYRRVDDAVADLVAAAGDDSVTMIMSDHGFGPCAGNWSMTSWLIDQGYAFHQPKKLYGTARAVLDMTGMKSTAARLLSKRRGVAKVVRRSFVPLDWSRTQAFFQAGTYGIRVNLRGRESEGIVEAGDDYESLRTELCERVLEMRDPATGGRVVTEALLAEEVYSGEQAEWAPDIILRPNPEFGYHLVPGDPTVDAWV